MKPLPILILLALSVSGCATSSADKLPVCDGKHRRPANPQGTVLGASASPAGAAAPAALAPQVSSPPSPGCGT
jgi:type IV secretion system protein VirB7